MYFTHKDVGRAMLEAETSSSRNVLKLVELNIKGGYNKLISDEETDEYEEHRGFLKVTLTPDKPYRKID